MPLNAIEATDKLMLLACSAALYLTRPELGGNVIPILIAVTFASLLSYVEREMIVLLLTAGFLIWSAFSPALVMFFPTVLYGTMFSAVWPICLFAFVPYLMFCCTTSFAAAVEAAVLLAAGILLRCRSHALKEARAERNHLRDDAKELSLKLERQNRELLQQQDARISYATLNERNRIAREIHDSVGHLLSSSILQVGALLAITRDDTVRNSLKKLNETLGSAMNSIRVSVHDLFDESIDLGGQLEMLAKKFTFCKLDLQYEVTTDPERKLKYAFLAIVQEALSNIIRHSNATKAQVSLLEHPAFFQLIISDNGTVENFDPDAGIGLQNIRDRVESFHGVTNITTGNGFRIFITIPKKEETP
jgi:signal transduction histidine kinase